MNEGETQFLEGFKNFLNGNGKPFGNSDVFLLRNLSREGIEFFISSGFYPGFIIWVRKENNI